MVRLKKLRDYVCTIDDMYVLISLTTKGSHLVGFASAPTMRTIATSETASENIQAVELNRAKVLVLVGMKLVNLGSKFNLQLLNSLRCAEDSAQVIYYLSLFSPAYSSKNLLQCPR